MNAVSRRVFPRAERIALRALETPKGHAASLESGFAALHASNQIEPIRNRCRTRDQNWDGEME